MATTYLCIEGVRALIGLHESQWSNVELCKLLHSLLHTPGLPLLLCVCVFHNQRAGRTLSGEEMGTSLIIAVPALKHDPDNSGKAELTGMT